ncbi:sAM-dependent methyltransferase [Firmicutes bacterium CAG:884]|nr:sAM-dependent methyltransferase [Firmicutes bacterium CAG:884]
MNEKNIIDYYNKFNENKRLTRRHGIVEYTTSMKYILKYLKKNKKPQNH